MGTAMTSKHRPGQWHLYPVDSFDVMAPVWAALNASGPATPLLDPAFIRCLIDHFATGAERLAVLGEPDAPAVMTLVRPRNRFSWQSFQPPQAPLGPWVARPDIDLESALAELLESLPGWCWIAALTQQDPDLLPRPEPRPRLHTVDYIETPRITPPATFAEFWAARGKNLRRDLKRQRNRLAREGITATLEVIEDAARMADAIVEYGRLESAGWKAAGGTAVHADNAQGRFYRALLEAFAATGNAIVFQYRFNKSLVATDLCIHDDATLIVLKTTYDPALRQWSPAQLMRQDAFEWLIEGRRFKRIEFYGRVMDWHRKWTDETRTLYHVNCYRWPLLARLHGRRTGPGGV